MHDGTTQPSARQHTPGARSIPPDPDLGLGLLIRMERDRMLDILNLGLWRFRNRPCLLRRRMGLGMRWDRLGWRRGMGIFDSEVIMGTGLIWCRSHFIPYLLGTLFALSMALWSFCVYEQN